MVTITASPAVVVATMRADQASFWGNSDWQVQ
jgi:hypothetical protein